MNRYTRMTTEQLEATRLELLEQREACIRRQNTGHAIGNQQLIKDYANEEYRINGELMALNEVLLNLQERETSYQQVLCNPVYGPQGETYRVRAYGTASGDVPMVDAWFWTQQEALEVRDRLFDADARLRELDATSGLRVNVDGLPTVICGS